MAAGQTVVRYGEITITNCLTKRFEQEAVYDDSGTDLLYYKFTIRVVGWCHGSSNIGSVNILPETSTGSAADHHRHFRPLLLEPRRRFVMRLGANVLAAGGQVLLECNPADKSSRSDRKSTKLNDLNNGPRGRILAVSQVAGDTLLRVEAEFEICKLECGLSDGKAPNESGVLNNRWSCVDDINENFYTTRTFTGILRLATSMVSPHSFRDWVVPGLQPGMRRKKMEFRATEDGLNLAYTVVDEEVTFSAPEPATDWKVKHTESLGENGTMGYAELNITLSGDRFVERSKLLAIIASVIEAKLIVLANLQNRNEHADRLLALSITDSWGSDQDNSVSAYVKVQHHQRLNQLFPMAMENLVRRIELDDYDPTKSRGSREGEDIETEGPIPSLSAFAAFLQTPCDRTHAIQSSFVDQTQEPSGSNKSDRLPEISAGTVDRLPDEEPEWMSEQQLRDSYTYWQMDNHYEVDSNKAQLPISSGRTGSLSDLTRTSSQVVSLGLETSRRIVRLKGERIGRTPVLPTPQDYIDLNGIRATLLDFKVVPSTPERAPDGQQMFRAAAEIIYALSRPLLANERARIGFNPWDNLGVHHSDVLLLQGGGH